MALCIGFLLRYVARRNPYDTAPSHKVEWSIKDVYVVSQSLLLEEKVARRAG